MEKDELIAHILESQLFEHWHWFQYHFQSYLDGFEQPFAASIVEALLDCDDKLPGFAANFFHAIASIGGAEKHKPHYEQLMQRLAELYIIRRLVTFNWPEEVQFMYEPTAGTTNQNIELGVQTSQHYFGYEVKCPALLAHQEARGTTPRQLITRFPWDDLKTLVAKGEVQLPRDNPVKDFLVSANSKFSAFKTHIPNFFGILVIVWDDFINEPISALNNTAAGLFTPKSFARNQDGSRMTFPNVDGVILIRQLHQFQQAAGDAPLKDGREDALEYGDNDSFPFKAYINNPTAHQPPQLAIDALDGRVPHPMMGGEYMPTDEVMWIQIPNYFELVKLSHQAIADKAYEIWQREGCVNGSDEKHWYQAIDELTN